MKNPRRCNDFITITSEGKIARYYPGIGNIAHGISHRPMPNPTPAMLSGDAIFEAIWHTIKDWDINVPIHYQGYMSGTGSHVVLIYDALMKVLVKDMH